MPGTTQPRRPGDAAIVPQSELPDEYRPEDEDGTRITFGETTHDDGSPTHYADGSPVFHGNGTPIDYRPRNIERTITRLPELYVRDHGQARLGHEGPAGNPRLVYLAAGPTDLVELPSDFPNPRVDPASGDVCWWAWVCTNPNCDGRVDGEPLVFAAVVPGVSADRTQAEDGDSSAASDSSSLSENTPLDLMRCPLCGRQDTLERPVLPDKQTQRTALEAELKQVLSEREASP